MDWKWVIDGVLGVIVALGGFVIKLLADDIDRLENKVDDIPNIYARRDDVANKFGEVMTTLNRIEEKLDRKADR